MYVLIEKQSSGCTSWYCFNVVGSNYSDRWQFSHIMIIKSHLFSMIFQSIWYHVLISLYSANCNIYWLL